jgi:hypothetical protein
VSSTATARETGSLQEVRMRTRTLPSARAGRLVSYTEVFISNSARSPTGMGMASANPLAAHPSGARARRGASGVERAS